MVKLRRNKHELDAGLERVKVKKKPLQDKPSPFSYKTNVVYIKSKKDYTNKRNNKSVVVKITSGAIDKDTNKRHIDYITRNGEIKLFDDENNIISRYDAIDECNENFDLSLARAGAKKSYNIAFSMSGKNDEEAMKKSVYEVLKKHCPNNNFYFALHNDTDNTHVHAVILRSPKDVYSKRLELSRPKLNMIKKNFAEQLNKNGIEASFQSYQERFPNEKRRRKRVNSNEYRVVDYGEAPYRFIQGNKKSFYLLLENNNGVTKQHWSKGLEGALLKNNVKRGDKITLKKINNDNIEKDKFQQSSWNIEVIESNGKIIEKRKKTYLTAKPLSKKSAFSKQGKYSEQQDFSSQKKYSEQQTLTQVLNNENTERKHKANVQARFERGVKREEGDTANFMQSVSQQRIDGAFSRVKRMLHKGVLFTNERSNMGQAQSRIKQHTSVQSLRRLRNSNKGMTTDEGTILDFGNAPYKFDKIGKSSFYILIENNGNIIQKWGKLLMNEIDKKGLKKGDSIVIDDKNCITKKSTAYKNRGEKL